ncbi:MAG: heparinase II/III family protein [Robiginitomaculum sp.]|nr:heparinase II/III family protein [Robiginitomaculum sp.]
MAKPTLANYIEGAVLRLRQAASDELHATPLYRAVVFSGSAPLLHKPWPSRPENPSLEQGEEIAGGLLYLAGRKLNFENVPEAWSKSTPSRTFAISLHSFGWLSSLSQFEQKQQQLPVLTKYHVDTWIEQFGSWNRFAWGAEITAKRCLAWLGQSMALFSGDAIATSTRLDSLGKQLRHLKSVANICEAGETKLWVAICLATAGTCLFGMKGLQKTGLAMLQVELDRQILTDGGHIGRNPEVAALLLFELDALAKLLDQHNTPPPIFIRKTRDKLLPFVRFCTMMNGSLAVFNGGSCGDKTAIHHALSAIDEKKSPFLIAPHSGYHRLQTRRSTLILDCGKMPPITYSRNAHAGALSFEFGTRAGTIITNCGWSQDLGEKWRDPSRTSAAHSTLVIDDVSSSYIYPKGPTASLLGTIAYNKEQTLQARRNEEESGVWLTASHQEYLSRYGLQHNRRLFLSTNGDDLRGEDTLERPVGLGKTADLRPIPFSIRFHLHTDTRVSLARNNSSVLILLPNGEGWRFRCDIGSISLEPSVYLGSGAPPRRSKQIVLNGAADPNGTGQETSNRGRWSLRRIESNS